MAPLTTIRPTTFTAIRRRPDLIAAAAAETGIELNLQWPALEAMEARGEGGR
jgi:hypothetical protein